MQVHQHAAQQPASPAYAPTAAPAAEPPQVPQGGSEGSLLAHAPAAAPEPAALRPFPAPPQPLFAPAPAAVPALLTPQQLAMAHAQGLGFQAPLALLAQQQQLQAAAQQQQLQAAAMQAARAAQAAQAAASQLHAQVGSEVMFVDSVDSAAVQHANWHHALCACARTSLHAATAGHVRMIVSALMMQSHHATWAIVRVDPCFLFCISQDVLWAGAWRCGIARGGGAAGGQGGRTFWGGSVSVGLVASRDGHSAAAGGRRGCRGPRPPDVPPRAWLRQCRRRRRGRAPALRRVHDRCAPRRRRAAARRGAQGLAQPHTQARVAPRSPGGSAAGRAAAATSGAPAGLRRRRAGGLLRCAPSLHAWHSASLQLHRMTPALLKSTLCLFKLA